MVAISRDQKIVLATLVAIAGLAWVDLFSLSQDMAGMDDMPGMAMTPMPAPFSLTAIMWAVMMVGMMLPSALPMILLFTTVQRKQGTQPILTTGTFAAGYLLIVSVSHWPPIDAVRDPARSPVPDEIRLVSIIN